MTHLKFYDDWFHTNIFCLHEYQVKCNHENYCNVKMYTHSYTHAHTSNTGARKGGGVLGTCPPKKIHPRAMKK